VLHAVLVVLRAADLAVSGAALQSIAVNRANDFLGAGGVGGVPAYWPDGRMVFVTDAGSGVSGIAGGVVAFSVLPAPACTLQVAWSVSLPNLNAAVSSPTVGSGLVFVGEGGSGKVHAYSATTGQELWNSGTTISGGTYAAPSMGGGKLFVGSWNGQNTVDAGVIRAFAPGAAPPPPNPCAGTQPAVLLGTQAIGNQPDSNVMGMAEAFQATAVGCGTVGSIAVYLDTSSNAGTVSVGIYADGNGHPGTLLGQGQGSGSQLVPNAWNTISISPVSVTQGIKYWIAILGTQSGTVRFRDAKGGCSSETSASSALPSLPSVWTTGVVYNDCPLSAYGKATP